MPVTTRSQVAATLATEQELAFDQNTTILNYPLAQKKLEVLRASKKINVFTGEDKPLEMIMAIPRALFDNLCTALKSFLAGSMEKGYVVFLQGAEKDTARWVSGWLYRGGKDMGSLVSVSIEDHILQIMSRLRVVSQLGIKGPLLASLRCELRTTLAAARILRTGTVQYAMSKFEGSLRFFRQEFSYLVIDLILDGKMTANRVVDKTVLAATFEHYKALGHEFETILNDRRTHGKQIRAKISRIHYERPIFLWDVALTFLLRFTKPSDTVRTLVAEDLVKLRLDKKIKLPLYQLCRAKAENTVFQVELEKPKHRSLRYIRVQLSIPVTYPGALRTTPPSDKWNPNRPRRPAVSNTAPPPAFSVVQAKNTSQAEQKAMAKKGSPPPIDVAVPVKSKSRFTPSPAMVDFKGTLYHVLETPSLGDVAAPPVQRSTMPRAKPAPQKKNETTGEKKARRKASKVAKKGKDIGIPRVQADKNNLYSVLGVEKGVSWADLADQV
ncbi:hypothetical protein MMC25_000765 [Agyrium rufum]|nr:hypothetical protein [Agyrium rufum]